MWIGGFFRGEVLILLVASFLTLAAPLGIEDLVKCNPLVTKHHHYRQICNFLIMDNVLRYLLIDIKIKIIHSKPILDISKNNKN